MAKIPAKVINFAFNTVPLEDEASSLSLNITNEAPVTTGLSDAGPRRVEGNYDHSIEIEGFWDGADVQGDSTIFPALLAGVAVATAFDPTGGAAGANDPNYDSTCLVGSYTIRGAVGGPVTYSATFEGATALARNT